MVIKFKRGLPYPNVDTERCELDFLLDHVCYEVRMGKHSVKYLYKLIETLVSFTHGEMYWDAYAHGYLHVNLEKEDFANEKD